MRFDRFHEWDQDLLRVEMQPEPPAVARPKMPPGLQESQGHVEAMRPRKEATLAKVERVRKVLAGRQMTTTEVAEAIGLPTQPTYKLLRICATQAGRTGCRQERIWTL